MPQPRRKKILDEEGDGKRAFEVLKNAGGKRQRASSNSLAQCTMPCAATRKPGTKAANGDFKHMIDYPGSWYFFGLVFLI